MPKHLFLATTALVFTTMAALPFVPPSAHEIFGQTAHAHGHLHGQWENYLFVANRGSADVAVIDVATDDLVTRIAVGSAPHQVALSQSLGKLAVTNSADDTLSVIDLARMEVTATLALGEEPEHMQLHPGGELLAVGNISDGSVSLVSLRENKELFRIAGLHEPHNLTFHPDGNLLYVSNLGANFISVIDVEAASISAHLPLDEGRATASLDVDTEHQGIINLTPTLDGNLGFAAFGDGDVMGIFDLRTNERIATESTGDLPWRAYASADGDYMIVPNNGDRTVSIFESMAPFREVARLPGGEDMTGVNASTETVFVIARGGEEIIMLDLETLENVGSIKLPGASPETGIITPDGEKLYVALSGVGEVAVIDVARRRLIDRIENVGMGPWGAFMLGADNYCH